MEFIAGIVGTESSQSPLCLVALALECSASCSWGGQSVA